jgi:lambda repressor-like predicted transcriptional regulator
MSVQAGTLPGSQQMYGQGHYGQFTQYSPYGPYGQQGVAQGPIGRIAPPAQWYVGQPQWQTAQPQWHAGQQAWPSAAPVVSDLTLRVVSAALATVSEQLRVDAQALQSLCAQGQLSPQAYSNVLVESARRCAPIIAQTLSAVAGGISAQHGIPFAQASYDTHQFQSPTMTFSGQPFQGQPFQGQPFQGQPFQGQLFGQPIGPSPIGQLAGWQPGWQQTGWQQPHIQPFGQQHETASGLYGQSPAGLIGTPQPAMAW